MKGPVCPRCKGTTLIPTQQFSGGIATGRCPSCKGQGVLDPLPEDLQAEISRLRHALTLIQDRTQPFVYDDQTWKTSERSTLQDVYKTAAEALKETS